jgi:imidazolonepropionase-like amidohydrolase
MIDATGAPANPDMILVIIGDRITEIGKSGRVPLPKDAHVLDAAGKFRSDIMEGSM